MIKLKENASKIFLDEFGVGEIQLKPVDNSLNYVWLPIEVFIDRYLKKEKCRYTRMLAQDNLAGIRLYLYDDREEKYNFVLTLYGSKGVPDYRMKIFDIISNNLYDADNSACNEFLNVLDYFEHLYCNYSDQLDPLSIFIEDIISDFNNHISEAVGKMYKDVVDCIVDTGYKRNVKNLLNSIKDEFIENYGDDEPEFSDIENDYDIIVEIIDNFFCNIEEEYDELYIKRKGGEEVAYSDLIDAVFNKDALSTLGIIEDILNKRYDGDTSFRDVLCIFDVLNYFVVYSENLLVFRLKEIDKEEE